MSTRSQHVKAWRKATKERMVAAMGGRCQCCGYDRCVESMDFHHVNPAEKEMALGAVRANPTAWPVIVNELRKCVLVCRNCHGELHYGARQLPNTYARFDERYVEYKTHPELCDACPACGKPKPKHNLVCSSQCGAQKRVDWSGIDLRELLKTMSLAAVADQLGVSQAAVWRKAKREGIVVTYKPTRAQRTYTPFVRPPKPPKQLRLRVSDANPEWRRRPNIANRKVERPSKEELTRMVWESSLLAVSKRYGVRDNTIRKWCKSYGIELPPQGYVQRRQAGYTHEESLVSQKRPIKGKRFITREIAEQAFTMKQQENLSYRKVAARFGFKHWGMQQAFQRYGLEGGCSASA